MITLTKEQFFTTPIYHLDKPEWVSSLIQVTDPYIKEAKKNFKEKVPKDPTISYTKNKDHGVVYHSPAIANDPKLRDFCIFVSDRAWEILNDQGYDLSSFNITVSELWVQEFSLAGGSYHQLHTHWNGHISGFYFLKASDKTSYPIFQDPRPGKMMNSLPEKQPTLTTEATARIQYKTKPGHFMFFNSSLPHSFAVDQGYEPFRFIHFNLQALPKTIIDK